MTPPTRRAPWGAGITNRPLKAFRHFSLGASPTLRLGERHRASTPQSGSPRARRHSVAWDGASALVAGARPPHPPCDAEAARLRAVAGRADDDWDRRYRRRSSSVMLPLGRAVSRQPPGVPVYRQAMHPPWALGHEALPSALKPRMSRFPVSGWGTRRAGATRGQLRCDRAARGRATGTCPRRCPALARMPSRCGR
jgi:hypothetical protein